MRRARAMAAVGAGVVGVMVVAACGGGASGPTPPPGGPPGGGAPRLVRLAVGLDPQSIEVGRTGKATASGVDQYDQPIATGPVVWTSSAPQVAAIDAAGTVTAASPGTASIRAAVGAISGAAPFTVSAIVVPPVVLRIAPPTASLTSGDSLQLAAWLVTSRGDSTAAAGVQWESSAPSVATLSPKGLARALGPGQAIVRATSGTYSGAAVIEVTAVVDTTIRIRRATPLAGAVVGDTLPVICTTNMNRPLRKVVAAVDRAETQLDTMHLGALGGVLGWGKRIPLNTVPIGVHQLVITAYALDGTIYADTTSFDREVPLSGGTLPVGGKKQVKPGTRPVLVPPKPAPRPHRP